jgi:hypothetical protein
LSAGAGDIFNLPAGRMPTLFIDLAEDLLRGAMALMAKADN